VVVNEIKEKAQRNGCAFLIRDFLNTELFVIFVFNYLIIIMPEIFRFFGIRFFYFSNEHLPIYVHIKNGDGTAKFSVEPVQLLENNGIKK
jgi:hypothetical protein